MLNCFQGEKAMDIRSNTFTFSLLTIENAKNKSDFLAMHAHDFYELIYLLEGNASYVVEGKKYKLQKND